VANFTTNAGACDLIAAEAYAIANAMIAERERVMLSEAAAKARARHAARTPITEPDGPDPCDLARDYNDMAAWADNHDATT
jgi:hypothetical protein